MTCIIGMTDGKNICIGGDSAALAGYRLRLRADNKIFVRTDNFNIRWAFGFTGSFRMGQLIQYDLILPKIEKDNLSNLHGFMVRKFIPALRHCLRSGGWQIEKDNREQAGTFIVGLLGKLFIVESDHQVVAPSESYVAIGSGSDIALGVLYALENRENEREKVIMIALRAAEYFNAGVHRPFKIVYTEKNCT